MNIGISFVEAFLIVSILIAIVYFSKKRIDNLENNVYSKLLLISIFGAVISIPTYYFVKYYNDYNLLAFIFSKLYLIYLIIWVYLVTEYFSVLSLKQGKINNLIKFLKKAFWPYLIIVTLIVYILPINYHNSNNIIYTYGESVNFTYLVCAVHIGYWLIGFVKNYKLLKSKKCIPIISAIIFGIIVALIQKIDPSIRLMTPVLSLVTMIMYFTIENPDVKMVNQLEYAKAQADKANQAKSEFLSSMSHEIRTPMNGIVGIAEYLRTENLSDEGRSLLDDLERVSNTLLEITSGIINISKIEQGAVDIVEKDYNIREIINDICTYLKPRLKDRPIDFKVEYAPDLPEILFGDKGKIREIITNLLTNSIKYTEQGSINLNIMCINEEDCCKLTIIVSDTGIGIREEMMNKLFEKFARDEDVTNTTIEGTGLGLAITKKLVDMLNGKITVSSVRGSGTTFTVYLAQKYSQNKTRITEINEETKEVIKQEEKIEPIEEVKNQEIETLEDNPNTTKVLIVDDNDLNLKVQKRHLDEYGYQVDTCRSGEECLKILENNKYDLILMDDMMPDISGTETMKKIKNDLKLTIPIVVITGNAKEEDRDNYLKEGFDEYLAKPFKKEELKQVIKKVGLL